MEVTVSPVKDAAIRMGIDVLQPVTIKNNAEFRDQLAAMGPHAIIVVGYGRVGKMVCALLKQHGIPFIAADSDAHTVTHDRRDGHDVYYGDAADPEFLESDGRNAARP